MQALVERLQPFMLHQQLAASASSSAQVRQEPPRKTAKLALDAAPRIPQPSTLTTPDCHDTLFGCFLELIGAPDTNLNQVRCLQEKIHWVTVLRQKPHKEQLKRLKLCSLTDLETNLANEEFVPVPVFLSLCAIHQLNVCVLFANRTCFSLACNGDDPVHYVREVDKKRKRFALDAGVTEMDVATQFVARATLQRPLLAQSAYKVGELRELAQRLGLTTELAEGATKPQLYQRISERLAS